MAHKHSVYDTDTHFSINPTTRALKNEASSKTCVIQHDHNSERFTFEIPRTVENHDMSLCNVVQVHYININPQTKEQKTGVYEVDDLQISPEGDDVVILSWLISQNATQLVGSLNFLIRFACVTDGNVDYVWNTAIYSGISVSSGIYNGEAVVEEYADILEQWRQDLIDTGGVTDDRIESVLQKYILENGIPGAGLTNSAQTLLVNILRNAVFSSNQSTNITLLAQELNKTVVEDDEDEPSGEIVYTIAYSIQNVTSSNTGITVAENAAYTTKLTAADGYTLDSVTVTMGGVDVTADVYADGVISISAVTGNVEIVASAVAVEYEDPDAVLPEDGLIAFFDLRNVDMAKINTASSCGTGYGIPTATKGEASLFAWGAWVDSTDDYGTTIKRTLSVGAENTTTQIDLGTAYTFIGFTYGGYAGCQHTATSNYWTVNPGYVKTDGSSGKVGNNQIVKTGNPGYLAAITRVDGAELAFFTNTAQVATFDGADYDGFKKWDSSAMATITPYTSSGKFTAFALYNRALNDVEIAEAVAYFETLEVA